jgi:DNA-binding MarR family transcriptional regulator
MPDSFYFPTFSGLLTKEHRDNIGPALWEFLWCISSTTKEQEEDGETVGIVLGGKPVSYNEVAKELGGSKSTVKRNFERLEEYGYIRTKRTPYGHVIKVRKSKKFKKSAKNDTGAENGTGAKNDTGVPDLKQECQNWNGGAENGHSNKDIKNDMQEDINIVVDNNAHEDESGGAPATEIVQLAGKSQSKGQIPCTSSDPERVLIDKYMQLGAIPGFDIPETEKVTVRQVLSEGVPLEDALKYLEECFEQYKPKHVRDKINSFKYCATFILNKHYERKQVDNHGATIHQYPRSSRGSAKEGKSYEQAMRELRAARDTW